MKCFSKPNLPEDGNLLICAKNKYTETLFENFVPTAKIKVLPDSMMYHADLQVCYVGNGVLICAPEVFEYYENALMPYGVKVIKGEKDIGSTYGEDCAYNILVLGNTAFHNTKYTDPVAKKYFEENGIRLIHVNQGYTKCAAAPVTEKSVITPDASIIKECEKNGINCLKIPWDGVSLSGFSHGFFGGCCGRISKDKFFVCGSLLHHVARDEIILFLRKNGFSLIETQGYATDIGSLVVI